MDDQRLLQQIAKLTQENNEILRGMRRAQRWGRLFRLLWWIFIIGTSAATYYYLQPIMLSMLETYEKALGSANAAANSDLISQLKELISAMK